MRLIDADALLEAIKGLNHKEAKYGDWLYTEKLVNTISNAPTVQQSEPFGYFKAEPFGWTDCAETDEGAIALYELPQPIEKCEPVGELILDPAFLPALKAPLVNWKINLVDLEVGTKLYTSPQPREWVGLSSDDIKELSSHLWVAGAINRDELAKSIEAKLKQLNTKG